jgi:DNA-binding XRE family transcriptional regulator
MSKENHMMEIKDLHKKWMENPEYKAEYDALEEEFALMESLLRARTQANLTQEQVAERMETSQATIARLERGKVMPSTRTLKRYAEATGTRLKISFVPL